MARSAGPAAPSTPTEGRRRSIFTIPPFSNPFLFVSLAAAALAHVAVLYVGFLQTIFRTRPLAMEEWILIFLVGTTVVAGGELDKWWGRRRNRPLG